VEEGIWMKTDSERKKINATGYEHIIGN
jgi:hypothetical protein